MNFLVWLVYGFASPSLFLYMAIYSYANQPLQNPHALLYFTLKSLGFTVKTDHRLHTLNIYRYILLLEQRGIFWELP